MPPLSYSSVGPVRRAHAPAANAGELEGDVKPGDGVGAMRATVPTQSTVRDTGARCGANEEAREVARARGRATQTCYRRLRESVSCVGARAAVRLRNRCGSVGEEHVWWCSAEHGGAAAGKFGHGEQGCTALRGVVRYRVRRWRRWRRGKCDGNAVDGDADDGDAADGDDNGDAGDGSAGALAMPPTVVAVT